MLTIWGPKRRLCDRASRRDFLKIGALGLGGASLPQLLRAEAESGIQRSKKSVIMIFLSGGPPHQDMFDLKPNAPAEIRGEFSPIRSNVPGIDICEHLPLLSTRMDRLALIRSVVGSEGRHAAFQCMTGRPFARQAAGGWPSFGSVVSKLQGPTDPAMPAFVGLSPKMKTTTWADPGQPGFLGATHAPVKPYADGMADMELAISPQRLANRQALLAGFDDACRKLEASSELIQGIDRYQQQAFNILTSNRLAEALDLERESVRTRDRYGRGSPEPAGYGDAGPLLNDYFLAARRLVEAGVRCVTLSYGRWDWHGKPHGTNFENAREHLPMFDQALSALLDDLRNRGLEEDVSVLVWGEFGRTPRINDNGGRDHWPAVSFALLTGGGMRTGQVIGSTDSHAGQAKDRPVTFQEIFATLYHNLGIDPNRTTLPDLTGRPQYLVDNNEPPIKELI